MLLLWQPGCFCSLCSASPLSFLPHLLLPCVCLWAAAAAGEEDQLITHWLYLPGLFTTSGLNHCIQYGDFTMLLFHVFCVLAFAPIPFSLLPRTEVFSAVLLCFLFIFSPEFLQASSTQPFFPACLPACLQPSSPRPHHAPAPFT